MPKIRILPEQLSNRIAAGEVVERPASVVKELIENSLDAKADRIEIEIEGGGTRLIRVIDNGVGMDEDDVLLCFERHGTSKISESHDLVAISTLGFRGEAIPSIASVAKMTLTSRPKKQALGSKVVFEYGRLQKAHEIGCSHGTVIEIRNLFGKTPARRKFLRTVRTELGHIDEVVKSYALACPEVTFSLKVNGKETLYLDGNYILKKRLSHILHYHDNFIDIGKKLVPGGKRQIHGYLVPPEKTISRSAKFRLFINGRAIKDRLMSHAVAEGLRGFLLKGHSPAGYLHLLLPAEEIDVNVHPAKHEVRFRNGRDIHEFIKQNVAKAMLGYQHTLRANLFGKNEFHSNLQHPEEDREEQIVQDQLPESYSEIAKGKQEKIWQNTSPMRGHHENTSEPDTTHHFETREAVTITHPQSELPINTNSGLRIVGQFKNLYIFCQMEDTLIVIDQHAAHERLLYEKFRRQYINGKIASQTLMFPETIELSPYQTQLVENNLEEIERMGFSISEFGGNSYIVSAVPAMAGQGNGSELLFDILDNFGREDNKVSTGGKLESILSTMACKAAVKSGDELSSEEIEALLEQMADADLFSHCPHGRPVLKSFTANEIKRWFLRT